MSAPEMINELKRLSNVIIGLDSMIAQQIITNTNLTNTIAELQNQVAQQTLTNTNLIAQIATLTTITGQLVEVNTRALDEQDQANQPLPYDDISMIGAIAGIINTAGGGALWTAAADWGAGNSFYISSITLEFFGAVGVQFLQDYRSFIALRLDDNAAGEVYFRENVDGMHFNPGLAAAGQYWLFITIPLTQLRRVTSGQTLRLYMDNFSGQTISCLINVSGIPRVE